MIATFLTCFDGPARNAQIDAIKERHPDSLLLNDRVFDYPFLWLATLISRSCSDIDALFEHILKATPSELGTLNAERYADWQRWLLPLDFKLDPEAGRPSARQERHTVFAFWLPSGIEVATQHSDSQKDLDNHLARFNRIEACYREVFSR